MVNKILLFLTILNTFSLFSSQPRQNVKRVPQKSFKFLKIFCGKECQDTFIIHLENDLGLLGGFGVKHRKENIYALLEFDDNFNIGKLKKVLAEMQNMTYKLLDSSPEEVRIKVNFT